MSASTDSRAALEALAREAGWCQDAMLSIACEYIDNQQSHSAFQDFIQQACLEDIAEEAIWQERQARDWAP